MGTGEENGGENMYATAEEVDGIRRTLDSFMKDQEKHNDSVKKSLDDLMKILTSKNEKLGTSTLETKDPTQN